MSWCYNQRPRWISLYAAAVIVNFTFVCLQLSANIVCQTNLLIHRSVLCISLNLFATNRTFSDWNECTFKWDKIPEWKYLPKKWRISEKNGFMLIGLDCQHFGRAGWKESISTCVSISSNDYLFSVCILIIYCRKLFLAA